MHLRSIARQTLHAVQAAGRLRPSCQVWLVGLGCVWGLAPTPAAAQGMVVVFPDAIVQCDPPPCPEGLQVQTGNVPTSAAGTGRTVDVPTQSPAAAAAPAPAASPLRTAPAAPAAVAVPVPPPARPAPVALPVASPPVTPSPAQAAEPASAPAEPAAGKAPESVVAPRPSGIRIRDWLREAVNSHPAIRSALQREGASLAEVEAARWQYFPTPSVDFQTRDGLAGRGTGFVRLQQPVYTGGRLGHQLDRATAASRASGQAVEEERRTIALRVIQATGEARAAALKRQAYRESAASHVEFLSLVQRRVNEGLSPRGDIVLARTRLASVRADLESAEVQLDQSLSRLEQLLGRPLEAVEYAALRADDVDDAGSDWAMPSLEGLVSAALEVSPSVRRGLAQLEAARAEAGVARAKRLPEVYMRAEHARDNSSSGRSQIYLGVSSNFGAGLSDRAALSAADQLVQAQQAEVDARRREVIEQVRAEHMAVMAGDRRVGVLADSANFSSTVVEAWRRQFLAGRKTWQDLMNAAREKAQADVTLGEATAARWVAVHRLRLMTDELDGFMNPLLPNATRISGSPTP